MRLFVWRSNKYLAVAHANTVQQARHLLITSDELGDSGDGSCAEHDAARKDLLSRKGNIFGQTEYGAEFTLTPFGDHCEECSHAAWLADNMFKVLGAARAVAKSVQPDTVKELLNALAEYDAARTTAAAAESRE